MFNDRVDVRGLADRLDAEFYHPAYVENATRLRESGVRTAALEVFSEKLKCGPFGSSLHASAYVADGVPFVHPTSFSSGDFDESLVERISELDHQRLASTCFRGPALVFTRVGDPSCGIVPSWISSFNIHGDVVGLQTNSDLDAHFAFSFFTTRYGSLELRRYQAGSTRPRTNTDSLAKVIAIAPDKSAQKYIGNIVRASERLRRESRRLVTLTTECIDAWIEGSIASSDLESPDLWLAGARSIVRKTRTGHRIAAGAFSDPESNDFPRHSRVASRELIDRLDANYYSPIYLQNAEVLETCALPMKEIGRIALKCNCGATPKDVVYDTVGQGLIRTSDVRPNRFLQEKVLRTNRIRVGPDSAVAAITGDILFTMSGTVGYAAVVPEIDEVLSFSNTIARVRLPKGGDHNPYFIAGFLNSRRGYLQTIRLTSGGIQGHVMPNPFKKLLVPSPEIHLQNLLGDRIRFAVRLSTWASQLARAAALLVESLIERRIAESELIIASKEPLANRDLLKRLTVNGLDIDDASPIFPDLDVLLQSIADSVDGFTTAV